MLRSRSQSRESEILERSELESDILRPTPQSCIIVNKVTYSQLFVVQPLFTTKNDMKKWLYEKTLGKFFFKWALRSPQAVFSSKFAEANNIFPN